MLDRATRPPPDFEPIDWTRATSARILERIREAGIVGMGGAGYPTAAKLASGLYYGTTRVIANGVECEPGVNADRMLMHEYLRHVIEGLRIVSRCLDCGHLTLAVSDRRIQRAFQESDIAGVTCKVVSNSPANGEERILIRTLFDRAIPSSDYPSQHGIVVLNVATLFAICEAVRDGFRPTDRVVTVFDEERWVEIDTPIGNFQASPSPLRLGSISAGIKASEVTAVELTTNAIACDRAELTRACIHCGWCNDVCPRSLPVEEMLRAQQIRGGQKDLDSQFDACFECGACVIACPSAIPLLDWIREGKRESSAARLKHRAHLRFERRNERLATRLSDETSARNARIQSSRKW